MIGGDESEMETMATDDLFEGISASEWDEALAFTPPPVVFSSLLAEPESPEPSFAGYVDTATSGPEAASALLRDGA